MKHQDFSLKQIKSSLILGFACFFLIIGFAGCSKQNNGDPTPTTSGYIAGINASEANQVDFYINNYRTNNSVLNPGQVIGYFSVVPTSNTMDFRFNSTSNSIVSTNFDVTADNYYSIFLADPNLIVTVQDDRTLPQTGKARIRFINLSSFLPTAVDFGPTGASKLASGLPGKVASNYYEVDPSLSSIAVYNSGSTTALFTTPVTLAANHVYIFYISGTTNGALTGTLLTQL